MKKIFIILSILVITASVVLFEKVPTVLAQTPSCFNVSGSVTTQGGIPQGFVTISCPGRPGICPGSSSNASLNGTYSLSGCNCLVSGGCLSTSNLDPSCRIISHSLGNGCYTNNAGNVTDDIVVWCDPPEQFKCENNACVSDNGDGTGRYVDAQACADSGCGNTGNAPAPGTCTSTPTTTTTNQCGGGGYPGDHRVFVDITTYSGCPSNPSSRTTFRDGGFDNACVNAPQCNPSSGNPCGCSGNCRDGANTDFSCCHRDWGTCASGNRACTTVAGAGGNNCSNGQTETCGGPGPAIAGNANTNAPGPGPACAGGGCGGNPTSCNLSGCGDSGCIANNESHTCNNGTRVVCNNGCMSGNSGSGNGPGAGPGGGSCGGHQEGESWWVGCTRHQCKDGVDTDIGTVPNCGPKACDPLGPVGGSPFDGATNLPPDVNLEWHTNEDPNVGACSGSGRYFDLEWGSCPTGVYNAATCVSEGTSTGRTSNRTCGGSPDYTVNWPGNPFPLTGLSRGWHYWNVIVNCSCHMCETGAPPTTNNHWMFEVGVPGPNTPVKVCHPVSGRTDDICGPFSYTGPTNTVVCANNGGGTEPQAISFTINNLSTGTNGSGVGAPLPTTTAGQTVCTNSQNLIPLNNTQTYTWTTEAYNSTGTSPVDNTPWTFVYDSDAPRFDFTTLAQTCYDPATLPPPLQIHAFESPPDPARASGTSQVWVRLNGVEYLVPRSSGTAYDGIYTFNFPPLTPGVQQVFIKTIDNVGNIRDYAATPNVQFTYSARCLDPFIQTGQGDVHSNTNINAPGGPTP